MRKDLTSRPIVFIPTLANTPLIVSTTPVSVPSTWIPNGASGAWICCDSLFGGVKFAFTDGSSVVNTLFGRDIIPGQFVEIRDDIDLIKKMQFVRVTGTDGHINFIFFQE